MKLRLNAWIIVECAHADGNLLAVRPVTPEQTGTARGAERLDSSLAFAIDADQRFPLKKRELFSADTLAGKQRYASVSGIAGSGSDWHV